MSVRAQVPVLKTYEESKSIKADFSRRNKRTPKAMEPFHGGRLQSDSNKENILV
jgi:hypothetical protein